MYQTGTTCVPVHPVSAISYLCSIVVHPSCQVTQTIFHYDWNVTGVQCHKHIARGQVVCQSTGSNQIAQRIGRIGRSGTITRMQCRSKIKQQQQQQTKNSSY